MADTVQYLLEEMIPELEDLNRRGIFTKAELRGIVKKRSNFEYSLKRRHRLRQDYLDYVQYEQALDRLRRLRIKSLKDEEARTGSSDHAMSRRIHFIFERALRRFKNDLQLWVLYLEFCRSSKASKRIQKVLPKALQLHPTVPGLWSYAAAHEFDSNNNAKAARTLLQRGLRMCPKAHILWHDLFRLELTYVAKLLARRDVLGLSDPQEEVQLGEDAEEPDEYAGAEPQPEEHGPKAGMLEGGLAILVARKGVEAIQGTGSSALQFDFLSKFFTIAWELDAPKQVEEALWKMLCGSPFTETESAWNFRAQYRFRKGPHLKARAEDGGAGTAPEVPRTDQPSNALQHAVQTYKKAIAAVPTPHMLAQAVAFYTELLQDKAYHEIANDVILEIDSLYSRAAETSTMCEATWEGSVAFKRARGKLEEAVQQAEQATKALPSSVLLWLQRIGLHLEDWAYNGAKSTCPTSCSTFTAQAAALEALHHLRWPESMPVWRQAVVACSSGYGQDSSPIVALLMKKLLVPPGDSRDRADHVAAGEEIACALLKETLLKKGVEAMREISKQLLSTPTLLLKIVLCYAELEFGCASTEVEGLNAARGVVETAIQDHGSSSPELWIQLVRIELRLGNISSIGNLHWRACKQLREPFMSEFITLYNELMR